MMYFLIYRSEKVSALKKMSFQQFYDLLEAADKKGGEWVAGLVVMDGNSGGF